MTYDILENGIKFDEWITGPQGAKFEIYPVKGIHSEEDIQEAKRELYRDRDVVKIQTKWITEEESDAMKLFLHPIAEINNQMNKILHYGE